MSLEAEERVNASTTNSNSTVEQSTLNRDRVEDLMLEQESQFREKQEEQARLLDELAGKLQSLDLSAAAEMVRFESLAPGCHVTREKMPCFVFNAVHFADESAGGKPVSGPVWGICDQARLKTAACEFLPSSLTAISLWYNQRIRTTLPCC